jgi:hypothetical protein
MADSSLSEVLKEAFASCPADEVIYSTLELSHPSFTQSIYVVNDRVALTVPLETGVTVTFVAFSFDLILPEVSADSVPMMEIKLDNVSREILTHIRLAMGSNDKITATHRFYSSRDLSGPQNDPPLEADLLKIRADVFRITASAGFYNVTNTRFPFSEYDLQTFPGLMGQ